MTNHRKISRWMGRLVTVIILGLGMPGCGGGGDGGGSAAPGSFTPDSADPGANTISLTGSVVGAELYLTVKANAISDSIYGAAFDLTFDPAVLTYVGYTAGDFFEQSGSVTYAVSARSDRLIVGVSGQRPGASATGAVMTLHLQGKASGSSPTAFQNEALCSSLSISSCDRQPSLSWFGGTYVYN